MKEGCHYDSYDHYITLNGEERIAIRAQEARLNDYTNDGI